MRAIALALAALLLAVCFLARPTAQQAPVFRATTESVPVYVSVRKGGQPVTGLQRSNFSVSDNGVPQTIDELQTGSVPADTTLFLGTGGTMGGLLTTLNADLKTIARRMRPSDRLRLLTYENQVTDAFGWRDSSGPGVLTAVSTGAIQALYDASFLALMHRPEVGRRHLIILITDGVEHGSVVDSNTVLNTARRTDAVLHLFLVDSTPAHKSGAGVELHAKWYQVMPDVLGARHLQESAQVTGGLVRHLAPNVHIVEPFDRAFDELRDSYVLYFTPTSVVRGGWHELRVNVIGIKPDEVRARRGYAGD